MFIYYVVLNKFLEKVFSYLYYRSLQPKIINIYLEEK